MKRQLTFLFIFSIAFMLIAQERELNEITSFKIKNSGAIMDVNNDVDGYYFFYIADKLKKGDREYAIKMLDNNLNDIATKSYVDNKFTYLADSKFNNQQLMFAMVNRKEKIYKLVGFNRKAEQQEIIEIPVSGKEMKWLSNMEKTNNFNLLFPIDDKGFLFNIVKFNKKLGYGLKYIATDGGQSWDYYSDEEAKMMYTVNPLAANDQVVVLLEGSKKAMLSGDYNLKLLVLDINNGELLWERSYDAENDPRMVSNVLFDNQGNIITLGEYFKAGDRIMRDEGTGLYATVYDVNGEVVSENKVDYETKINPMLPKEENGKDLKGYTFFHDIIKTEDNKYYAVGERYKRTANALGILSAATGNYNSVTQLTITDAFIYEFDERFNLEKIHVFEKGKSRAPSLTDFGSPHLNAHALKGLGAFDYEFTQYDKDRNRFYATFIDYERLKGEANKFAFKSLIFNDGKITEDKIYLEKDKGRIDFRVMPGKIGHVMLLEYNSKEKTLDIHLEKMNVE